MDIYNYPLSELLLFSPAIYAELIASYNSQVWPLHYVFTVLGIGLISLAFNPSPFQGRGVAILLILAWAWLAYVFYLGRVSTINWVAYIYTFIFTIQILRLTWMGVRGNQLRFRYNGDTLSITGLCLILTGFIVYPILTGTTSGLSQTETFGLFPIPTLIVTFGILLLSEDKPKIVLAIAPFFAALLEGLTAIATGNYVATLVLWIAILSIFMMVSEKFKRKAYS